MFSSLGTKLALKKLGVPKDALTLTTSTSTTTSSSKRNNNKNAVLLDDDDAVPAWPPKWMSVKRLPLTAQTWLAPSPPPVPVAASSPRAGERAPRDASGKLVLGGGKRVMVVFLRCVGCAFAQQTFLALRALSTKAQLTNTTFVAVSHASPAATRKWLDLLGGAWNVQVVIDEDRALYAAWGLGLSSVWYYFNPTTQGAAWRDTTGWLGRRVAVAVGGSGMQEEEQGGQGMDGGGGGVVSGLGNKWQEGGAWAVDGNGVVVWGRKAERADEVMDLAAGFKDLQG